jgi:polyribonucleotide nucleotidyltransferase
MDIKIGGITEEIMQQALSQAKVGRTHILGCMSEALTASRSDIASTAPQIKSFKIPKEKIGELIGPGGKMIKSIIERTNVKIDIADDGTVNVASVSGEDMAAALEIINDIIAVPEIGAIYNGKVVKVTDFGAFVAIMKNCEGLVHVSEMSVKQVKHPRDFVSEHQQVVVKVLDIDKTGRVKLSMKAAVVSTDTDETTSESDSQSGDAEKQEPSKKHHKHNSPRAERESNAPRAEREDVSTEGDRKSSGKRKFKKSSPNHSNDFDDRANKPQIGETKGEKKLRFF